MERQAGLGRSLEDVLESFTPIEPEPSQPERALFEPEDLEQQLDQLMGDIRDLRERVQHLVGMVPDGVVPDRDPAEHASSNGTGKKHKKKAKNKKKSKSKSKSKKKSTDE
jgi:hypothetical protein